MPSVDVLDRIWNDLDPRQRVPPDDPRGWYADLSAGRGRMDFAGRLAKALRRAEKPLRAAILGHLGSGKSTELARLRHLLEIQADRRFHVIELLVDQELDKEDVDAADVQLLMLERLVETVLRRGGRLSEATSLRLSEWLEPGEAPSTPELDALHDAISLLRREVQVNVERRGLLRRRTQAKLRARLDALRELAALVSEIVTPDAPGGLVILIDGVEMVALLPDGRERARKILLDQSEQWDHIGVSMVFTAPLSLLEEDQRLANLFGWHELIPALPVVGREPGPEGAAPGTPEYVKRARAALKALLENRVGALGALFATPEVLEDCVTLSGGSIRDLFRLIREAIDQVQDRAPQGGEIEAGDLEVAWRRHSNKLLVALQEKDKERINKLKWNHEDFVYDALGVSLLQRELILPYVNGGRWFAVHPALARRGG